MTTSVYPVSGGVISSANAEVIQTYSVWLPRLLYVTLMSPGVPGTELLVEKKIAMGGATAKAGEANAASRTKAAQSFRPLTMRPKAERQTGCMSPSRMCVKDKADTRLHGPCAWLLSVRERKLYKPK